jgi:hypothetical protein
LGNVKFGEDECSKILEEHRVTVAKEENPKCFLEFYFPVQSQQVPPDRSCLHADQLLERVPAGVEGDVPAHQPLPIMSPLLAFLAKVNNGKERERERERGGSLEEV